MNTCSTLRGDVGGSAASGSGGSGNRLLDDTTRCKVWLTKNVVLVKPEQAGKTHEMIHVINSNIAMMILENCSLYKDADGVIHINFICCDNSLALVLQTMERFRQSVNKLDDKTDNFIELSSSNNKDALTDWRIIPTEIEYSLNKNNVLCCTNKKRIEDITKIITYMDMKSPGKYKFNIWIDEADKYLGYINELQTLAEKIEDLTLYHITATPKRIIEEYGPTQIMKVQQITSEDYHGWDDCDIVIVEDDPTESVNDFALWILEDIISSGDFQAGWKGYVPSGKTKKKHYELADECIREGIAVFVVNGDGIHLFLPGRGCVTTALKNKEISQIICDLYEEYDVKEYPCIVTGKMCISRGITFMRDDFMFDIAVLSDTSCEAEVSQQAGRMKGNLRTGHFSYQPTVYTTAKFDKIARESEKLSRKLCELAYQSSNGVVTPRQVGIVHNKRNITRATYDNFKRSSKEFSNYDEAFEFAKTLGAKNQRSYRTDEFGFKMCSAKKTKVQCASEIRELATTKNIGSNMNKKLSVLQVGEYAHRMYVCYEDIRDITTELYIIIYVERVR